MASKKTEIDEKEFIKKHEGFRSKPYKDKDTTSVGYGFNIEAGGIPQDVISGKREMNKEEADIIFANKLEEARGRSSTFAGNEFANLNDNQKLVLLDMAYNLGNKLFEFEKMQKAIKNKDKIKAAAEMKDSNWYNQVGNRSKEDYNLYIS